MAKKSALELAEEKCEREQRKICVHREKRDDLADDIYYVTPKEKVGENVSQYELLETFEPEGGGEGDTYRRLPVDDFSSLESGDRVVVNQDDVHTITEVTSRQIITNFGDKFRKSDGVEWGGGQKRITNKLVKNV